MNIRPGVSWIGELGCAHSACSNGFSRLFVLEGLLVATNQKVDLVLLDINLPDIDGYEVARRLRSSGKPELTYVPIIAITANALKGDAEKALEAGCDVYMSKPINIRELWARVEGLVPSDA
jgi:CheY-like chemotaxis protein